MRWGNAETTVELLSNQTREIKANTSMNSVNDNAMASMEDVYVWLGLEAGDEKEDRGI
jgi:hypothetical protein